MKDSNVASRGQVFYYNPIWGIYGKGKEPRNIYQNNGCLEFKTRPYLIVSNDNGNFSSTTCNIIPITSRDNIAIPSQVKFVFNGRNQVILTEQITTCNFKDLGDYCYTVSDEILMKVQKGLYIQFGLNLRTPEVTMEELVFKLDAVVDKVIENVKRRAQSITIPQDTIDNLAIKLGSAVEDLVRVPESVAVLQNNPGTDCDQNLLDKPLTGGHDIRQDRSGANPKTSTFEKDTGRKPRKQPWDIEKQKQFLADCDKLTPNELMVKYGFATKKSVYNHKYLIKSRLNRC